MEEVGLVKRYKVWTTSEHEISVLSFVKEHKLAGFVYPNMTHGMLFVLSIPEDLVTVMRLKFLCKIWYAED